MLEGWGLENKVISRAILLHSYVIQCCTCSLRTLLIAKTPWTASDR